MTLEIAARITSEMLRHLAAFCAVGVSGHDLEKLAEQLIIEKNERLASLNESYRVSSYNKGYHPEWAKVPFPAILCVCPNGIIAHGVPSGYKFRKGDIVTIDLGIRVGEVCGDAALTVPIGEPDLDNRLLLQYSRRAVYKYISLLKPGANTRDLVVAVEKWVKQQGFRLNRRSAGHRINEEMHMKPNLYNTVEDDVHTYGTIKEGEVYCVEPILTRSEDVFGATFPDGWSRVTMDRKNTAMFEHMVEITKTGAKILTNHFTEDQDFVRL